MYVTERYEDRSGSGTIGFVTGGVMIGVGLVLGYKLLAGQISIAGTVPARWMGLVAGLPLILAGLGLTGWIKGKCVDAGPRMAFSYWGFFKPWKYVSYPLAHYRFLTIAPATVAGPDGVEMEVFAVSFLNDEDSGLTVFQSADYWAARREAGELARMLQMPVHDKSEEMENVLKPGDEYGSLRTRLLGANLRPDYPPRPPECRVNLDIMADEARMEVPKAGFSRFQRGLLAVGIAACLTTIIYLIGVWNSRGEGGVAGAVFEMVILIPLGVGFGAALIIHALRAAWRHEHVWASPRGISVERGGMFKGHRIEMSVDDVEQVDVWHGVVRIILRDGEVVRVGMTLNDAERDWMREIIRHMITGRERGKGSTSFY